MSTSSCCGGPWSSGWIGSFPSAPTGGCGGTIPVFTAGLTVVRLIAPLVSVEKDTQLVHLKLLEIWIQLWHAHKENSMIWYEPGSQTRMTESSGSENRGLTRPYVPRKMLHGSKNICGSVILRMFCKPGINATIFSSVDSLTLTSVLTGNVSIILNVDTRLGVENFCGRTCLKGTGMSSFRMSKSLSNNECSSNLSWCMHVPQSSPLSNSSSMSSKRNSCLLSVT